MAWCCAGWPAVGIRGGYPFRAPKQCAAARRGMAEGRAGPGVQQARWRPGGASGYRGCCRAGASRMLSRRGGACFQAGEMSWQCACTRSACRTAVTSSLFRPFQTASRDGHHEYHASIIVSLIVRNLVRNNVLVCFCAFLASISARRYLSSCLAGR